MSGLTFAPAAVNGEIYQDTVTGAIYNNISNDGQAAPSDERFWFENYIDIRPTADAPQTSMKLPQILMMIARFMVGANTANMSPWVSLPPAPEFNKWRSAMDWGFVNPSIIIGTEVYKVFSRYWLDSWNYWRNEGGGNFGLGLLKFSGKVLLASVPSALLGFGIGAFLSYSCLVNPPLSRIIAALISPWIYVGTKKLIDHFFPSPEYQTSVSPPLHPVQRAGMLAFNIMDAVNIYEFIRILIKEYGPEELIRNPHFGFGVVLLFLLLSNIIDPIAFGHSPIYGPAPFDDHVTSEEIGNPIPAAINAGENPAAAELAAKRNDAVKNGIVYAACATLALGAGLAADAVASRVLGDTTTVSNTVRKLGVGLTCTAAAVTQVALVNGAPWIIDKAKTTWASFFNNNTRENLRRPPPPSFSPALVPGV